MQNLTHLRNIQFVAPEQDAARKVEPVGAAAGAIANAEPEGPLRVDSQAKLILFKGI